MFTSRLAVLGAGLMGVGIASPFRPPRSRRPPV